MHIAWLWIQPGKKQWKLGSLGPNSRVKLAHTISMVGGCSGPNSRVKPKPLTWRVGRLNSNYQWGLVGRTHSKRVIWILASPFRTIFRMVGSQVPPNPRTHTMNKLARGLILNHFRMVGSPSVSEKVGSGANLEPHYSWVRYYFGCAIV